MRASRKSVENFPNGFSLSLGESSVSGRFQFSQNGLSFGQKHSFPCRRQHDRCQGPLLSTFSFCFWDGWSAVTFSPFLFSSFLRCFSFHTRVVVGEKWFCEMTESKGKKNGGKSLIAFDVEFVHDVMKTHRGWTIDQKWQITGPYHIPYLLTFLVIVRQNNLIVTTLKSCCWNKI